MAHLLDDEADHLGRGDAAVGGGALRAQGPDRALPARVRRAARVRRRRDGEGPDAAGRRADPDVAPAHPHVGADLRVPPSRRSRRALPRGRPRVGHAAGHGPRSLLRAVGRAAAAVPARHGVELRRLHRRARPRDRGDRRAAARRVPRRPRPRPARHERHRVLRGRGRPRPARRALRPPSRDRPRGPQPGLRARAAPARPVLGRRRARLDRRRLRALHAHAAETAASSTACACSARARCG